MSPFDFPLQTVLELRERQEAQSARDLAEARKEATKARQVQDDLQAARDAGRARMSLGNWVGGAVGHVRNLIDVVGHVDAQVAAAERECGAAEEQVEESMKAMRRSAQKRQMMDRLRERQLDLWEIEQAENERKAMDELALSRHHRAGPSSSTSGE